TPSGKPGRTSFGLLSRNAWCTAWSTWSVEYGYCTDAELSSAAVPCLASALNAPPPRFSAPISVRLAGSPRSCEPPSQNTCPNNWLLKFGIAVLYENVVVTFGVSTLSRWMMVRSVGLTVGPFHADWWFFQKPGVQPWPGWVTTTGSVPQPLSVPAFFAPPEQTATHM